MAKKARTPPPPRRVQAPKQRRSEPSDGGRRRLLLIAGIVAAALVIGGGAVAGAVVLRGGDDADATIAAAGCEIDKQPAMGRQHVQELDEDFEYNTFPPTTGPHHGVPLLYDFYPEPVEQFRLVHNLEHGAVAIQYGSDVPEGTVDQLRSWYLRDPNGLIVAPLPDLEDKVALGAWVTPDPRPGEEPRPGQGVVATCPGFDEAAFDAFVGEYGFRGPERFPREEQRPGT